MGDVLHGTHFTADRILLRPNDQMKRGSLAGSKPNKNATTYIVAFLLVDPKGFEPSTSRMRTSQSV